MTRAYCLIRPQPVYRHDAFMRGLTAAGFLTEARAPRAVEAGDVLCIWNRYGLEHDLATRFEAAGGTVLVAENGYVGPGGASPHDMEPRCWYALAVSGHNGRGTWPFGDSSRWDALGIELKPWRTEGKHILVAPNRPFGQPGNVMPADWANDVARRLRAVTDREIRIRPHPGNGKAPPLEPDLRDAWATVIWSSSVGVQSLIAGVPVICEAPFWICKSAAMACDASHPAIDHPQFVATWDADIRRLFAMQRLAWAQWHVDEIATGEPFARLIERAMKRAAVAA